MSVLTILSPLSAWLVMLSLGLGATAADRAGWKHELAVRYWFGVYVLPLLLIGGCLYFDAITEGGALGLALCVLSGSGTSGVAWAKARGASGSRVTTRLASGALIALVTMPLAAALGAVTVNALQVAITVFLALMLAQWLPWQVGRWWGAHRPMKPGSLRMLERAAAVLAIVLAVTSAFEADVRLEAMGVIRNLTLVTLVLTQANAPQEAMTALAAFGALMYPAAWLAALVGRTAMPVS